MLKVIKLFEDEVEEAIAKEKEKIRWQLAADLLDVLEPEEIAKRLQLPLSEVEAMKDRS